MQKKKFYAIFGVLVVALSSFGLVYAAIWTANDMAVYMQNVGRHKIYQTNWILYNQIGPQVATVNPKLNNIQSDVASLESDIASLQSDAASIQSQISSLQSEVSNLDLDVSGWKHTTESDYLYFENIDENTKLITIDTKGYKKLTLSCRNGEPCHYIIYLNIWTNPEETSFAGIGNGISFDNADYMRETYDVFFDFIDIYVEAIGVPSSWGSLSYHLTT